MAMLVLGRVDVLFATMIGGIQVPKLSNASSLDVQDCIFQIVALREGSDLVWFHVSLIEGFNISTTLPETNIAPENGWLEYYFPIGEAYFQGLR